MAETSGLDLVWLQKRAELCGLSVATDTRSQTCAAKTCTSLAALQNSQGREPPSLITYATGRGSRGAIDASRGRKLAAEKTSLKSRSLPHHAMIRRPAYGPECSIQTGDYPADTRGHLTTRCNMRDEAFGESNELGERATRAHGVLPARAQNYIEIELRGQLASAQAVVPSPPFLDGDPGEFENAGRVWRYLAAHCARRSQPVARRSSRKIPPTDCARPRSWTDPK